MEVALKPMFAFFCRHSSKTLIVLEIFCKINVDALIESVKTVRVMAVAASAPPRAVVEHLVRQAVYSRLGKPLPRTASAPNPLVVNISARHCHLTPEAVEIGRA